VLYEQSDLWEREGLPGIPISDASESAAPQLDMDTKRGIGSVANSSTSVCEEGEEKFMGECYKSCSSMTGGKFPARFAPNGCCKELSFSCLEPSEVAVSIPWPGHGYMVGGDGGAPHPPGECDPNEEGHLGLCYKKCSILTDDEYPIRVAANTCCKERPCMNLLHLKTRGVACTGFGVGGGMRGHNCPHKRSA
jgi:hypothetical protein